MKIIRLLGLMSILVIGIKAAARADSTMTFTGSANGAGNTFVIRNQALTRLQANEQDFRNLCAAQSGMLDESPIQESWDYETFPSGGAIAYCELTQTLTCRTGSNPDSASTPITSGTPTSGL